MTYKVKSVKLDGSKAVITVESTHPDVMAIVGPILAMALSGGDDDAKAKVRKAITEKLASGNFPTATTVFTKTVIKEADGAGLRGARGQVQGYASSGRGRTAGACQTI